MKCEECGGKAEYQCVLCGALFCEKCNDDDKCLFCDPRLIPIKCKKVKKKKIK